jgi:hypothetical protein
VGVAPLPGLHGGHAVFRAHDSCHWVDVWRLHPATSSMSGMFEPVVANASAVGQRSAANSSAVDVPSSRTTAKLVLFAGASGVPDADVAH